MKKNNLIFLGNISQNINSQSGRVYSPNGISPSLLETSYKRNEPKILLKEKVIELGNIYEGKQNWKSPQRGRIYDTKGLAPTIITMQGGGTEPKILTSKRNEYRIRRLTERECFRLMDVDEHDIDTLMNCGLSKTRLYRLAGNSIVISCMYHLFRKLFVEPDNEIDEKLF